MTFDIALSGINAASTDLEVISHNIANSATTGFKKSRAEFADVFATSRLGSSSTAVGRGVQVASIRQDFTQGDVNFTDNNLDLSIDGQGLFRISDNGKELYTRAGQFGLDREGYVVNSQDQRLVGYGVDEDGEVLPISEDLQIDYADIPPKVTENVSLSMNLDSQTQVLPPFNVADPKTYNYSTATTVYDSLGASQVATSFFKKDSPNEWSVFTYVDGTEVSQTNGDQLSFNAAGELTSVNGGPSLTTTSSSFNPQSGANPMSFAYDLSAISQFEGTVRRQRGRPGRLHGRSSRRLRHRCRRHDLRSLLQRPGEGHGSDHAVELPQRGRAPAEGQQRLGGELHLRRPGHRCPRHREPRSDPGRCPRGLERGTSPPSSSR